MLNFYRIKLMDFKEYIKEIDRLYSVGNTTEHSFRGSLQSYLSSLLSGYIVTNEPRRRDCGAPDYVITQNGLPVAFFEAKDIDDGDLDGRRQHKKQFDRYKASLDGIIFTDYLDFHLYQNGEFVDSVRIAETRGNHIVELPENRDKFEAMVSHLVTKGRQRITSSSVLARLMAGKAHLLAEVVNKTIVLEGEDSSNEIATQLRAFRDVLIHDLKAEEFADIYAQTIVYGMFTARLNDSTPEDFSRQEAANLIPKSNPFLRRIFQSIAGYDIDSNIEWIVDDLAAMFSATDAVKIMANYGSNKRHSDPIVHFYEDFLAEYDPKLRKARGVWYTPAPVVKFIVKSVDEILQAEFGLPMGLADSSTIKVKRAIQQSKDKRTADGMKHEEVDVHRVQILDPATGTGTFLAEVIQQVRDKFDGMEGMWPSYVEKSLIPRIHGFEILMASYTIAHLKLSYTLKETGYTGQTNQRLNVFLTNSLEEATPRATNLFAKWLSDEADAASLVKTETPVMICLGNPPYAGESSNKNIPWIDNLVEQFKKEPGTSLSIPNTKWLNDDYVKFIRMAENYIEKNKSGIVAFINPHGYLSSPTFRGMRYHLLNMFDSIYILNLHGNGNIQEKTPDGELDENVFDILQGVCINIFVKNKKQGGSAQVFYADLYGTREYKYEFLSGQSVSSIETQKLAPQAPLYYFKPFDYSLWDEYQKGFPVNTLFKSGGVGICSKRDAIAYRDTKQEIKDIVTDFYNLDEAEIKKKYHISSESRDQKVSYAKDNVRSFGLSDDNFKRITYRPFDDRWTYFTNKSKGFLAFPVYGVMKHLSSFDNMALVVSKSSRQQSLGYVFIVDNIVDLHILDSVGDSTYIYPLRCYTDDGCTFSNLESEITSKFDQIIGEKTHPEAVLSYVYAVLHSPEFRERYKEYTKDDFPRISYPKDAEQFHRLAEKGAELRKLHLMEDAGTWKTGISFPVVGENNENPVESISFSDGKVYINKAQYFGNVSELAWNFYIGGYQPAQKWLKDRKGRKLEWEDIMHYGRIIYALQETDRLMKEIDEIGVV